MPKLPQKIYSPISVNLIPQDPFLESVFGKFLVWSLSIGRYIVVLTELIVIVSFLSRFKLDRELTDLNESIATKQAIIESYQEMEVSFLNVQEKLNFLSQQDRNNMLNEVLAFLEKTLSTEVKLTAIAIQPTRWTITANSLTPQGVKMTADQVAATYLQDEVSVNSVKYNDRTGGIEFEIQVQRKTTTSPKAKTKSENAPEQTDL